MISKAVKLSIKRELPLSVGMNSFNLKLFLSDEMALKIPLSLALRNVLILLTAYKVDY